jgi:hypothetical protein
MRSDFAQAGMVSRAQISVGEAPMGPIRMRVRRGRMRERVRIIATCLAVTALLGAGVAVGARIYSGFHVTFVGNRIIASYHTLETVRYPTKASFRDATAHATFPTVFPVGLPAGARVENLVAIPARHPSAIVIGYRSPFGRPLVTALLFDAASLDVDSGTSLAGMHGPFYHFQIGAEIVVLGNRSSALVDNIKASMLASSPTQSLAATEAMLPSITVVGNAADLPTAWRLVPNDATAVLIGSDYTRMISRLAARAAALPNYNDITSNLTADANGSVENPSTLYFHPIGTAISANGVQAINAVLHGARCSCDILFEQTGPAAYVVWKIANHPSTAIAKFAVDAKTLKITSE